MNGPVHPPGWDAPRGYNNGYRVGNVLFVAGQVSWDAHCQLVAPGDFAGQFHQALQNVKSVLDAAGARVDQVGRVTVYVSDKDAYIAAAREVGVSWRAIFGRHYPAMSLVQVAALLEPGAMVEIEATAVLD